MGAPSPKGAWFEFKGQRYFLPEVTQDDKVELHAVTNEQAMRMARLTAKKQSDEDAYNDIQEARRLVLSGHFWWDESGGLAYRQTREGLTQLVWICLKRQYPPDYEKGIKPFPISLVREMAQVDWGRWLDGVCNEANPTPPPSQGGTTGENSTPDSPRSGDVAATKSAE